VPPQSLSKVFVDLSDCRFAQARHTTNISKKATTNNSSNHSQRHCHYIDDDSTISAVRISLSGKSLWLTGFPLDCRIVQVLARGNIPKQRGTKHLAIWYMVMRLQVVSVDLINFENTGDSSCAYLLILLLPPSFSLLPPFQRVPIRLRMTSTVLLGCHLPSRTRVPI
jgi:hypothetical protein